MTYVFDTSSFVVLKNFYRTIFSTLWDSLEVMIAQQTLISVHEVYNELHNYNAVDFVQEWAKKHRAIFAKPSKEEQLFVQQILSIRHFQPLITTKAILKGTPVADPFVVAAAKIHAATVVTEEALKPSAAKIPNVCKHFGVPCVNLQKFMEQQGWTF